MSRRRKKPILIKGARGDCAPPATAKPPEFVDDRTAMGLMKKVVAVSHKLVDEQVQKIIDVAVSIRDNPDASGRDRLRASELLEKLAAKGVDVAQYIDKTERLDQGKPTENVNEVFRLSFDESDE